MQILDGGISRQLQHIGAPFRQPEWSALALIESPSHVSRAHQDFIDAGADIITTNSYAVVPFHIGDNRFLDQGADLLHLAGKLAHEAKENATRKISVAASIPPMFGSYAPDKFDPEKATGKLTLFRDMLLPHSDLALGETLSSIADATAFQEVFADCGKPVWVALTLEDEHPEAGVPRLRSGELLEQALEVIGRHNPDAILFNCSQPEVMADGVALAKRLLDTNVSIGVYANAFPPENTATGDANAKLSEIRQDLTPLRYQEFARQWQALGATIIGGCCGVGSEHIKALKKIE